MPGRDNDQYWFHQINTHKSTHTHTHTLEPIHMQASPDAPFYSRQSFFSDFQCHEKSLPFRELTQLGAGV